MMTRDQWRAFVDHPVVEWTIFVVGVLLMIAAIPVGALPGPGGVFVFAIGLAMVLKTSMWAKRRYVRFKRKQPKIGRWADWGLRRRSARRREEMLRQQREDEESLLPEPPPRPPETWADREGRADIRPSAD
ncbi:MAG TPA: hypothetical protein VFK50_05630 [Sphingomicrobium sp.]|nr:hypothetical protein [Sphingomicrobium sp.]